MAKGSGRVKQHPTDASIEAELSEAIRQWKYLTNPTHRRIIRVMELMVLNHRQVFDLMSADDLLRQASLRQGMLYAFKLIASMSQAILDQNPDGAVNLAVQPTNPDAQGQQEDDYYE